MRLWELFPFADFIWKPEINPDFRQQTIFWPWSWWNPTHSQQLAQALLAWENLASQMAPVETATWWVINTKA